MSAACDGRRVAVRSGTKAAYLHEPPKLSDETIEATLQTSNSRSNVLLITSGRGTSARTPLGPTYGVRINAKSVIINCRITSLSARSAIFRHAIDVGETGSEECGVLWKDSGPCLQKNF